jgi:hypothetical protein
MSADTPVEFSTVRAAAQKVRAIARGAADSNPLGRVGVALCAVSDGFAEMLGQERCGPFEVGDGVRNFQDAASEASIPSASSERTVAAIPGARLMPIQNRSHLHVFSVWAI